MAVKKDAVILWQFILGACNAVIFENFMIELNRVVKYYIGTKNPIFYMDNCQVHHSKNNFYLKTYINIYFTPSYSE